MMYLETPPRLIETKVFSAMPDKFRRKGVRTEWADANRPGAPTDCFIEGPSFDADGNLYIVDIPFGRIFRIAPDGKWSLVVEYDGWPNGLKIAADGRILVADYRHGIMELDAKAGRMQPVLTSRNSESFKRLQRPASRLQRRHLFHRPGPDRAARSDRTGLSADAKRPARLPDRYRHQPERPGARSHRDRAVRRDDARQRGLAAAVHEGRQRLEGRPLLFAVRASGPDGMTMDKAGRLFVAHASLGHVFVFAPNGELIARIKSCAGPSCTNVAIGGAKQRSALHHGVGDRHRAGRRHRRIELLSLTTVA